MRVLSALVLTHCFSCVITEDYDDNFMHKLPAADRRTIGEDSKIQISSSEFSVLNTADPADDRRQRYDRGALESQTTGNGKRASFMNISAAGREPSGCRQTSSFSESRESEIISLLPERSAFNGMRENSTQISPVAHPGTVAYLQAIGYTGPEELVRASQINPWYARGRGAPFPSRVVPQQTSRGKQSQARGVVRERHRPDIDMRLCRRSAKKDRNYSDAPEYDADGDDDQATKLAEEAEAETGEWDEWTEWSECSASCGCGRQVRWRHCVGEGCTNGLKKAQIKTCHLRDCSSKNFLSWLGMKA